MQSAGLRTRRSVAASVDDSASIFTLHSLSDGQTSPEPGRRGLRTMATASQIASSAAPSLIIERPEPLSPASSAAPSLIIQRHDDDVSRPSTASRPVTKSRSIPAAHSNNGIRPNPAPKLKTRSQKKIEQLLPDYRPETTVTGGTHLAPASAITESTELSDLASTTRVEYESSLSPPKFTIDLSRPPRERYWHVAPHFRAQNKILQRLFDDLIRDAFGKKADKGRKWGKRLLRKIPSPEEQEELEGIAEAWDVDLYLLVAFNVLLDTFMGCTSGGVRVRDDSDIPEEFKIQRKGKSKKLVLEEAPDSRGRMLHFRTLDWAMDPLRRIVCQFEYVNTPGGEVVARSLTYFGFVGVLTGVRRGLSLSLNFRPCHDASSAWKRACFRFHQLCVVLGFRRSIASALRDCLIPSQSQPERQLPTLVDLEREMPGAKSTAAYLIFSDGARTTTMEKDRKTAVVRSASDFIVALNHDVADDAAQPSQSSRSPSRQQDSLNLNASGSRSAFSSAANSRQPSPAPGPGGRLGVDAVDALTSMQEDPTRQTANPQMLSNIGLGDLVVESKRRKRCIARHWKDTKSARGRAAVRTEDVLEWMKDPVICSDETHYVCVMDPTRGEVVWSRRWVTPLRPEDPR